MQTAGELTEQVEGGDEVDVALQVGGDRLELRPIRLLDAEGVDLHLRQKA